MNLQPHPSLKISVSLLLWSTVILVSLSFCKKDEDEEEKEIKTVRKELCDDTCIFSGDGECDDGGPGSATDYCGFGRDCTDCGMRYEVEVER